MDALRMAADDDAVIEGWAVPFDGCFNGNRDSYGTIFSARTEFRLDWYEKRPLLWHHGLDKDVRLDPVGTVRSMEVREKGVWMQAQLDRQSEYFEAIRQMVKDGKVFLSSGSVEHLVQINARTGHVDVWPIVEQTLTTTPSNLLADIPVASFRAMTEATLPDDLTDDATIIHQAARARMSQKDQDNLPDSAFAYVEPGGMKDGSGKTVPRSNRHLPYKGADGKPDKAHTANALARLDQTDIPDAAKAAAKKKLMAAAKTLGMDAADDSKRSASLVIPPQVVGGWTSERDGVRVTIQQIVPVRADPMDGDDDPDMDGDDGDDVGTDERSFEDICSDLDGLLNPMYASAYTARLDTFPTHVLVKRCEYGAGGYGPDDDEGVTYWDIPYTIGPDREPVLGTPVPVERNETFTPVARSAAAPLAFNAQLTIRHVAALTDSTKGYGERRFREGRVLSAANLKTISDTADGLEEHAKALRDLHGRATGHADTVARAALFADPETRRGLIDMLELLPI